MCDNNNNGCKTENDTKGWHFKITYYSPQVRSR